MKTVWFYNFPVGRVAIAANETGITDVTLDTSRLTGMATQSETPLIKRTARQLQEYFNGKRQQFTVPLAPKGTEFQSAVWDALRAIPYGETRYYAEIAAAVGRPKAARAVGMANNHNPIMFLIPCHRVIGRDGSLVGYAGGLSVKQMLLKLEQAHR